MCLYVAKRDIAWNYSERLSLDYYTRDLHKRIFISTNYPFSLQRRSCERNIAWDLQTPKGKLVVHIQINMTHRIVTRMWIISHIPSCRMHLRCCAFHEIYMNFVCTYALSLII